MLEVVETIPLDIRGQDIAWIHERDRSAVCGIIRADDDHGPEGTFDKIVVFKWNIEGKDHKRHGRRCSQPGEGKYRLFGRRRSFPVSSMGPFGSNDDGGLRPGLRNVIFL